MNVRFPDRVYLGFTEWALDPAEADHLLERGHALVDGVERRVRLIERLPGFTQVAVDGTDAHGQLRESASWQDSATVGVRLRVAA